MAVGSRLLLLMLVVAVGYDWVSANENDHIYTNEFAVEIDGDVTVADLVAGSHNLRLIRKVAGLENVYHYVHDETSHRSRRSLDDFVSRLVQDPNVRHVEQQRILQRDKRGVIHDKQIEMPIRHFDDKSVYQRVRSTDRGGSLSTKDKIPLAGTSDTSGFKFNDPYYNDQWYLSNHGQTGGVVGYDINVIPVWKKGITGRGVVVTILDDGIDHNHPDLRRNYDVKASADLNDKSDSDNDPVPNTLDPSNSHGTRCAGEVAAEANNSNCCVGVAFNARIGGVRMLDGPVTDLLEADAVTYNNQYVDIYSASWGPTDDGKTMEGPHRYCQQALKQGVTKGRGGKGSIFVWATGNGGSVHDDCSCDGYVSSIYTLSVGCISDHGLSTYFSEICPSTMAVVFTGGSHQMPGEADYKSPKIKVVTTDLNGDCTLEFQGTSSAAPLAAGCIALVLEANGNLTWRDVQNIVVETARIPNAQEDGWTVNGGGHHVNHRFGFGALDCARMVEAAQNWVTVQEQHECTVPRHGPPIDIYANRPPVLSTLSVDGCRREENSAIDHLEHVQVKVKLQHERRGDLAIVLTSPAGTKSNILSRRLLDDSAEGIDFTFMTVHNWGEDPQGVWTLSVEDIPTSAEASSKSTRRGRLISWSLTLYGVAGDVKNHKPAESAGGRPSPSRKDIGGDQAREVDSEEVKQLMASEEESSDSVQIESKADTAKKQASDGGALSSDVSNGGFGQEDVEFLRRLFEAEELINKRNRIGTESDGSDRRDSRYQHGLSGRRRTNVDWEKPGAYDRGRNVERRTMTDENEEATSSDVESDDVDTETLNKILRDLSKYVND